MCDKRYHHDDKEEMSNCNIQSREQSWSRMDKLHCASNYSDGMYRLTFHHYCARRNEFVRKCATGDSKMDTGDLESLIAF